jgi:DNA-binding NtrC family response regulator
MRAERETPLPRLAHHRRVLIVEDEPRLRDMLVRAVSEMGFDPTSATSAEQALRALDRMQIGERQPLTLLLDLNLPGMGGLDLLDRLRDRAPQAAVVVLTGFGSLDAAKVAIRYGVVDFLTKPCRLEELEVALTRAMQKCRASVAPDVSAEPPTPAAPSLATLEELERLHIETALDQHDGNRSAAAAALGISERTLYYRLARYARRRT